MINISTSFDTIERNGSFQERRHSKVQLILQIVQHNERKANYFAEKAISVLGRMGSKRTVLMHIKMNLEF
jgi:hypothetical protein